MDVRSRTAMRALFLFLGLASSVVADAQVPLPKFTIDVSQTSVSGLSSGGFMAVQFQVAYSHMIRGAGIIAGGPYFCARGDVNTALDTCSCARGQGQFCSPTVGTIDIQRLKAITDQNAASNAIDATSNLANQKIWMFHGTSDTVVPAIVMDNLQAYYAKFVGASNISYVRDKIPAGHGVPVDSNDGNACGSLAQSPFINNCNFDAAGELLKWLYEPLNPRNDGTLSGAFIHFDQTEFIASPNSHGMDTTGWVYVPKSCAGGAACKVHIAFHGCQQGQAFVGDRFVKATGYNKWADTNNIIVLYPQAAPSFSDPLNPNPLGCWDWWGYDDPDYAKRNGRQMAAVKAMVDRIAGLGPAPAPTGAQCFTASNFEHIQAGRAHGFFVARANGSNELMGWNNVFTTTTLRQTGPDFYVVGTCP